jgi:hypothetical protein
VGSVVVQPPKLFISYRRNDAGAFVQALDARLRHDLGGANVFRDAHDLIVGEKFEDRIMTEIEGSDAVLVVIGRHWDGSTDDSSNLPRLADPNDFVRREVRAALDLRRKSMPIPVLVEGATFPHWLPPELEPLKEHEYVELDEGQLERRESPNYQRLLVGVWVAKSRSVPNGVIVFGDDDSPTARARLDDLIADLTKRKLVDVRRITRYASNARVLSMRKARRLARKFPHVIVLIDQDSAQSSILAARIDALSRYRVGNVTLVAIGGGITFSAGVAVGTGALADLSPALSAAIARVVPSKLVTSTTRLLSWQAMLPTAPKIAAGALAAAAIGGGAVTIPRLLDDEPGSTLAGEWEVGAFGIDVTRGEVSDVESFEGGLMSFRNADPECDGHECPVIVTDGPEFLVGATIGPGRQGALSSTLIADTVATIRSLTGGGLICPADDGDDRTDETDITDRADVSFDARAADESGSTDLEFVVRVHIPAVDTPTGSCTEATIEWNATAQRINDD